MENVEIRQAVAADARVIARIKRAVWPDETADENAVATVISGSRRSTHLAFVGTSAAGFVDGFLTSSNTGAPRWEVDLLAVELGYRRRGIARQLIAASTHTGRQMGAARARGLVQVQNIASQRAFAACGYVCGGVHTLYVDREDCISAAAPPEGLHLTPVMTLNYRGLWLEGTLSSDGFCFARAVRQAHCLEVVGAVIPVTDERALEAARQAGYSLIGYYHWWTLEL